MTAFSANSYCRYRQLGWFRFTADFKFVATWFSRFSYEATWTICQDSSARMRAENQSVTVEVSVSACVCKLKNSSKRCNLSVSHTIYSM